MNELSKYDEYGQLFVDIVLKGDQDLKASIVNLHALLFHAFAQGGGFYKLMMETMEKHPPNPREPYSLVLYSDEVVPGNALSHDNKRKIWMVYGSLMQFGSERLSQECAWLTLASCRSSFLAQVHGGIGQLMKEIVKNAFQSTTCDLQRAGILLKGPDNQMYRVWVSLGAFVQDGAAHKYMWAIKGDAGSRCCFLCKNCISKRSGLVNEEGGDVLVTENMKEDKLEFTTDSDIWKSVGKLKTNFETMCLTYCFNICLFLVFCFQYNTNELGLLHFASVFVWFPCSAATVCHHLRTKADFTLWQQAAGMNYQPHGMLFDDSLHTPPNPILRPSQQFMHDWMHLMCVGGIVQTTVYLFLETVSSSTGMNLYKMIAGYMALWVLPKSKPMSLENLFSAKRQKSNREAKTFKCQASEVLAFLPILAIFVQNVVLKANHCVKECEALLAVADLLAILQAIPHGCISPDLVRRKVSQIQDLYEACGWDMWMHSKFHWLVHLASHFQRFGILISCWVHERKHRIVKRYSQDIQNTRKYEKHVMVQVVAHDLALLLDDDYFGQHARLKKKCKATKKVQDLFAKVWTDEVQSCHMCVCAHLSPSGLANRKDVVIMKCLKQLGEVWFFAEVIGECVALVSLWVLLEQHVSYSIWKMQDNPQLVSTSEIKCALSHRPLKEDQVMVSLPVECR
jgi:hypothetical protein